jgi:NADH-quinone oxidoreductase subunit N
MMSSLYFASPALALSLGCVLVLMMGLWIQNHTVILTTSLVSLATAGGLLFSMVGKPSQDAFAGLLVFDNFGLFFSLFAVFVGILSSFLSSGSKEVSADRRSEFYSILLALVSGLVFMVTSNHFLMIYLAIETVSILSYTLAGFNREKTGSVEASLKYVVYGSMASAIMIFGMSLLYGATGSLELTEIRSFMATLPAGDVPLLIWVAVLMIFAGIGYKVSAAPMHMWTPDVYEGAPTPVSAFLSVAPKAAGLALLVRFFITAFSMPLDSGSALADADKVTVGFHLIGPFNWPQFLMLSSIFTMFMGNLAALAQVSVKRILAYSSIAHAGYSLMGLTTQSKEGITAMVFYMAIYCFMNLGAFWVTSKVDDAEGGDSLKHFKGLSRKAPFLAVSMAIFLFSLIGIPPFAGFVGKFYLFSAVIVREMYGFAILAALNSVISLYYYAKIMRAMFLESQVDESQEVKEIKVCWSTRILILLLVVPNIVLGLYWEPLFQLVKSSINIFVGGVNP